MNNSFQQCVADICGLELSSLAANGKYTVYGNNVAVVEGHSGIVNYTSETVSFAFCKGVLEVCGSDLKIRCLEKHYSVVAGKISSVAVKNV